MSFWSRRSSWPRESREPRQSREDAGEPAAVAPDPDEAPTGQIPALSLATIIEEADGTTSASDTSERAVEPVVPFESPTDTHGDAYAERAALIELCLYALDRARSGGVAARIEEGLATVGVQALRPDGDRFDPAFHEAGATLATSDADRVGTVAETEVIGFRDRDRVLRAPVVTVYTKG